MIDGWRAAWRLGTRNNTAGLLPFGFVQLSTKSDSTNQTVGGYGGGLFDKGYAALRWTQTASYGYAPNAAMPGTFMATAVDIGQANSPAKGPHVQDKEDVGVRLALAWREAVLGDVGLYAPGPIADRAVAVGGGVSVVFRNLGFELSAGGGVWVGATHVAVDAGDRSSRTARWCTTSLPGPSLMSSSRAQQPKMRSLTSFRSSMRI
eukprot:gene10477-5664_t